MGKSLTGKELGQLSRYYKADLQSYLQSYQSKPWLAKYNPADNSQHQPYVCKHPPAGIVDLTRLMPSVDGVKVV